jgi:glycyl-tRNA synthetase beta chain
VVCRGHERVLRARLEDAGFYFKEDTKTTLESKQEALKKVVFHTLLGTSWEKVERFSRLADVLADRLVSKNDDGSVKKYLLRAAALCKCDLVSGVVGEFPALQGVMGSQYALKDGEHPEVARAIAEHYWPIRAGGQLPDSQAGALLSMADKMDTICGCFGVGLIPTGAADPFALRRQALGIMNIILDKGYRLSLSEFIDQALSGLTPWLNRPAHEVKSDVMEFFRLRLKNQLTGQNASTDIAEAVLSLHCDDIVPAVAGVWALEHVKARPDFEDLAEAFKRVVNIIRKFGAQYDFDRQKRSAQQEIELDEATAGVESRMTSFVEAEDYTELLSAIIDLKPAVDNVVDHVLVDDPDPAIKKNRLALLTRVARLFETVADFTKIST